MWRRKNSLERGLATMETNTAVAVDQLAERIRERMDNETGQQLAQTRNEEQLGFAVHVRDQIGVPLVLDA